MRKFTQAKRLQGVRYDVRGANMVEAVAMESRGERILKLHIGNTAPFGLHAPESMVKALVANLEKADGYSESAGIFSARTAVMNYYQAQGIDVDVDHVWLGNGVSELISIVLQAITDPGDEILIPAPDYPLWTGQTTLSGARPVHYLCDENNGWNPDLEDIRSKITPHTKALVIINPNNPTGAVYSREIVQGMIDLAREHGLIVLSDEIYEKIIFEGEHTFAAPLCGDDVLCITFSGLSKAYRACGWRAGWMIITGPVGRATSVVEGITLLCNMRMCSNVPAQYTIQTALGGEQSIVRLTEPGGRLYEQLTLASTMLNEIPGVSVVPARGALYLFPRLDPTIYPIEDDSAWALGLLRAQKVLISHGTSFNWPHPDHFRLVALPDTEVLTDGIHRIAEYLAELREDA
ncbi:MAG: pyridoxal phosphate-dependent aminotransferase [Cellulomonadaceae bacterium]|nr:pyridoxal phosphate-dependent aminotransferase [Cellulomonadaceae bacterium]